MNTILLGCGNMIGPIDWTPILSWLTLAGVAILGGLLALSILTWALSVGARAIWPEEPSTPGTTWSGPGSPR